MKRLFILASAAIVALASCSKTQVVYNDAPEEIGFKTYAGAMTKALDEHTTMGVFARPTAGYDVEDYFTNALFQEGTPWTGSPAQYWPLGNAALDFVFYAPHTNPNGPTWTYTAADNNKLTITVDNSTTQTNWLYGSKMETGSKLNPVAAPNPVMKHLLAKITINLTGTIKLNDVAFTDTKQTETATVSYTGGTSSVEWSDTGAEVKWNKDKATYKDSEDNNVTFPVTLNANAITASFYVIPSIQTTIALNYAVGESSAADHAVTLEGNWIAGKHYTYNVNAEPGEITFSPTVEDWTLETATDIQFNEGTGEIL